ncbi:hypothetical protein [Terrisporobacter muris]|uniref:Ribbon-helix-helix protein CopG domain-containing protein n=1 Tax=Terrisporobacter muris TaxID=2963284 RepID=A0A9X2MF05_9FIRM|nr:hypothetical protein [Terrisporobacter muris]MCR1825026.1 hypothetical protein [Terrisporobacter muris]
MKNQIKTCKIDIKNLSKETINKIDELARKKGLKRSEFLEKYIEHIASQKELFEVFNRYECLLKRVENSLKYNTEILDKFSV